MPVKPIQRTETNNLAKGLATDLGYLTYPEGASIAEENFDMMMDGSRRRRLGLGLELSGMQRNAGTPQSAFDSQAISTYAWKQAGGIVGSDLFVMQLRGDLFFWDTALTIVSKDGYMGKVSVGTLNANIAWSMSAVDKYLVVAGGVNVVAVLSYKTGVGFNLSYENIQIRDLFGVQETTNPMFETDKTYRGGLTPEHYYNLYNQGWAIPRYDWKTNGNALVDAVSLGGNGGTTKVPSNGDKVWTGMAYRPVGTDVDGFESSVECFHYTQFEAVTGADVDAAKGYFIIDAFNRSSSRQAAWEANKAKYSQSGNLIQYTALTDVTLGGPTCVAAHAGRMFYSGVRGSIVGGDNRSPGYNNTIFFTQVVDSKDDLRKCYQEGDPTSRESNDLVDSDGGFLMISEAAQIIGMFSLGAKLFVLAANGLWSITGGSDYGFSATNYRVDKLSTFGGISPTSIIVIGDSAYYWTHDGITQVSRNQMGDYEVKTISNHIKSFYDGIPVPSKGRARGLYDAYAKRVSWVYNVEVDDKDASATVKEGCWELFLDLEKQAFFPFYLSPPTTYRTKVVGGFEVPPVRSVTFVEPVIKTNLENIYRFILDDPDEQLVSNVVYQFPNPATVKYVTISVVGVNTTMAIAQYNDKDFRDWTYLYPTAEGNDAKAYILTGDQTIGDVAINKQIPYLTTVLENTDLGGEEIDDTSSCIARCQWGFTDDPVSGGWSRPFQVYRHRRARVRGLGEYDGNQLVISKTKVRGRGKAFALYYETEPYKDCRIIGWNVTLTKNDVT